MITNDNGKSWCEHEDGKVAVILLTDQMPRSIYRKTGKAFEFDHISRAIAYDMIKSGEWEKAKFMDKFFISLTLEHHENQESLDLLMKLRDRQLEIYQDDQRSVEQLKFFKKMSKLHVDIFEQFGRYPHRNDALCRESTQEEIEWLETGETFGQK